MNTENLTLLIGMMRTLGFEDEVGYQLAKKASFCPDHLVVTQNARRGDDVIRYDISFQLRGGVYHLRYYDASLRKAMVLPDTLAELDKRMSAVEWSEAFSMVSPVKFDENDVAAWKQFEEIASIVRNIEAIEDPENRIRLKVKYWADVQQDMFNLYAMRTKFEITQRFYFFEDNGCISMEDAYRFLQNRWMEKQMLAKKKSEVPAETEAENGGGKLLQKKRGGGKKKALL